MENISRNTDTLTNFRGTTCRSFIIGKREISFASEAITETSAQDLSQYKTLVVRNDGKSKIIYDMNIDRAAVKRVEQNQAAGTTTLILMDGTRIGINGAVAGVESDVTSNDPATPGEIVVFKDTTGKVITKSGYSVIDSNSLPGSDITVQSIADLEALIAAYNADNTLDTKIPTMQAVIDYVGSIDQVLELRRNGLLPAD